MAMTAAQLLDELMGRDRNLVPGEKSTQVHWSHVDVSFQSSFLKNTTTYSWTIHFVRNVFHL